MPLVSAYISSSPCPPAPHPSSSSAIAAPAARPTSAQQLHQPTSYNPVLLSWHSSVTFVCQVVTVRVGYVMSLDSTGQPCRHNVPNSRAAPAACYHTPRRQPGRWCAITRKRYCPQQERFLHSPSSASPEIDHFWVSCSRRDKNQVAMRVTRTCT